MLKDSDDGIWKLCRLSGARWLEGNSSDKYHSPRGHGIPKLRLTLVRPGTMMALDHSRNKIGSMCVSCKGRGPMRRVSCNRAPEKEGGRSPTDVEGALLQGPDEEGLFWHKARARPVIRRGVVFSQGQPCEVSLVMSAL